MKATRFVAPLLVFLIAGTALADRTMHGVRNLKCAASEEEAKIELGAQLKGDAKLCETGEEAVQSGGWSCKSGGDCKKGAYRCNTQFICEPKTLDLTPSPLPTAEPTPAPSPTKAAALSAPLPMPNVKVSGTPKPAAPSGEVKKREFKDGDTVYVEESETAKDGVVTTKVAPKTGPNKSKVETTKLPNGDLQTTVTTKSGGVESTTSAIISEVEEKAAEKNAAPLAKAIGACEPYKSSAPFPLKAGSTVDFVVHGMVDGKCKFTQTITGMGGTTCFFTTAERAAIAKGGMRAYQTTLVDPDACHATAP